MYSFGVPWSFLTNKSFSNFRMLLLRVIVEKVVVMEARQQQERDVPVPRQVIEEVRQRDLASDGSRSALTDGSSHTNAKADDEAGGEGAISSPSGRHFQASRNVAGSAGDELSNSEATYFTDQWVHFWQARISVCRLEVLLELLRMLHVLKAGLRLA